MGSFSISRGIVDAPDHVGESYGWQRLEHDQADAKPRPLQSHSNSSSSSVGSTGTGTLRRM
jgi:hypothetical protein